MSRLQLGAERLHLDRLEAAEGGRRSLVLWHCLSFLLGAASTASALCLNPLYAGSGWSRGLCRRQKGSGEGASFQNGSGEATGCVLVPSRSVCMLRLALSSSASRTGWSLPCCSGAQRL